MDNGKIILETQNQKINLDKLLAQRTIYTKAKVIQLFIFLLTIFFPFVVFLLNLLFPDLQKDFGLFLNVISCLVILTEIFLDSRKTDLKKIAVSIQESFDTKVLNIPENLTLNINRDDTIVYQYSKVASSDYQTLDSVTNWYSTNIKEIKTNLATVLCQKSNVYYDFEMRSNYNLFLLLIGTSTFTLLFSACLAKNLNLQTFFTLVVMPTLPLFIFTLKEYNKNNESIKNLEKLKDIIESVISECEIDSKIDVTRIRQIQDKIYRNRELSPLVPDYLYNFIRPKLEDKMNYAIEAKITELLNK